MMSRVSLADAYGLKPPGLKPFSSDAYGLKLRISEIRGLSSDRISDTELFRELSHGRLRPEASGLKLSRRSNIWNSGLSADFPRIEYLIQNYSENFPTDFSPIEYLNSMNFPTDFSSIEYLIQNYSENFPTDAYGLKPPG